ncbi:hypothetical protein PPL_07520 [Heterostelium album PN500]|uniref:B box-type domain-containing protein n=1 Tax=Heterostelium pallidum (strain ATCC 26659 / Pp 5 / PN500) TaxID=670386 RepID=D3BG69_HETP5|nr:hypothetical protein PPL_07520 [Heterostelium album PN500]EFA79661.1 hypothetical protein PPL_07520 [Heterostelium album PN500]|eukprot:XP_020431782.1 hypothetical protein PPL_07520 [Heterostelium album PN500]
MNRNNNNICVRHKRSIDLICYDCNVLMCPVCSPKHARHFFDHIDNIKSNNNDHDDTDTSDTESTDKINNIKNNNNRFQGFRDIKTSMQSTFDSLKLKVAEYEQLQQTEQEIESKFKELHEFLVVEEHRLKTPIINNKQQLERQIDKQIKIMKSLNTVNNHISINNNINNSSNNDDRSSSQSSCSSKSTSTITTADTIDRYQISAIITSISQCSDHNEFISSNNNTLFHFDYDQLGNKVNNNDDHSFLNLLLEHNKSIKINNHHDNQQQAIQQYKFIVNNEPFNQIKNNIQSSFGLVPKQDKLISIQDKQSYIFSTDKNNKISIINITDRNNIHFEQQDIDIAMYNSFTAYNSIVKVGDFIYIFGGGENKKHNKYLKYSINTKTVIINEMKGVNQCDFISACYDGQDHIYLFDGFNKPKTDIYRYNINNSTFERYSTIDIKTDYHHLTFLFKGFIYTFTGNTRKIFLFMKNKTTVEFQIDIPRYSLSKAACTDGNGNIYLLSTLGLHRINIEANEIKLFDNSKIDFNTNHNLIYHQSNDGQTYIYSIEGKNRNFMFSFENNKWESILQNDQSDRTYCANIFYQ